MKLRVAVMVMREVRASVMVTPEDVIADEGEHEASCNSACESVEADG